MEVRSNLFVENIVQTFSMVTNFEVNQPRKSFSFINRSPRLKRCCEIKDSTVTIDNLPYQSLLGSPLPIPPNELQFLDDPPIPQASMQFHLSIDDPFSE